MEERRLARLAIVIGVAAMFVAVLLAGASYTSATVGCASCHDDVHSTSVNGTHSAVACTKCHVPSSVAPKLRFGFRVLTGMRLRIADPKGGGVTEIPNRRCLTCHVAMDKGSRVVGNSVKLNHASCAANSRCVRCHDSALHGAAGPRAVDSVDMFECLECHTRMGQEIKCDSCHAGRLKTERIKTGTFAVTHGPNWREAHGIGSVVACGACHDEIKCARCHGLGVPHTQNFMLNHGAYAETKYQKCESCHQSTFCHLCHGMLMPHPSDFKIKHAGIAKSGGDKPCKKCHAESDCTTCHTLHVHPGGAIGGGNR